MRMKYLSFGRRQITRKVGDAGPMARVGRCNLNDLDATRGKPPVFKTGGAAPSGRTTCTTMSISVSAPRMYLSSSSAVNA